jgi:3-hydroxyisobutyrate dehydrogenase-like beta-hydroxyacid dehydrogenase
MEVGFIGLGNMGSRIVALLLDGGHRVTVWARRPASVEPFAGRVAVADRPAGIARAADVIGLCVWSEEDVVEVLGGEDGLAASLRPGTVVVVHSTVSPSGSQRLRQELSARGVELIDAPVSVGANLPKLLVLVGGEPDAVQRAQPVLQSIGDPVLHLGPVGSGQIAKLVNNTMLAATIGLGEDALAFGASLGLDIRALATALATGSARGTWNGFAAPRDAGPMEPSFATGWASKDVGHALELAATAEGDLDRPVLRLARRGVDVVGGARQTYLSGEGFR